MICGNETLLFNTELAEAELHEHLPDEGERIDLASGDLELLEDLWVLSETSAKYRSEETNLDFHCEELAERVRAKYDAVSLSNLSEYLGGAGTLSLPIIRNNEHQIHVGSETRSLTLLAATEIGTDGASHGDMSSMIYLRDQIQAATALMEASYQNSEQYTTAGTDGRDLLISALHLMSTEPQLKRLENVIKLGPEAGQADWPNISVHFNDLEGTEPNGWRNKQDTFQMLAYLTIDALERGFIDADDLTPAHRQFLGAVVPLLASVGFPKYETSGSWEELAACRTSVMSVETALLAKIQKLPRSSEAFRFLQEGYAQSVDQLPDGHEPDFVDQVDQMVQDGLHELGKRLPCESPDYAASSVKYRDADVALVYVLRYGIPELLAENRIPMTANGGNPMSAEQVEDLVITTLIGLIDPDANGIFRYLEDSYQRTNFHTDSAQMVVRAIKSKVNKDAADNQTEADLDQKQKLRNTLMPGGKPAAWTHPLGQMASWAAKQSRTMRLVGDTVRADYLENLSTLFLNTMLTSVTGDKQWHAALGQDGHYQLKRVPAKKVPECIITYEKADGTTFAVPSPHTPLNWGTAMLLEALGMLKTSVARDSNLVPVQ